jgi:hypothetical protein
MRASVRDSDAAHSPRLGRCNFFARINLIRWRETMGSKDSIKLAAIFAQEVTGILTGRGWVGILPI